MSKIVSNVLANYAGTIVSSLLALLFIPLYIRFMGMESYGLVGLFASLQALLTVLDLGLSQVLNRELARLSVMPDTADKSRDLTRTLEVIYWCGAALICSVFCLLASPIAHYWVNARDLSEDTVTNAVRIMGPAMGLLWPASFYQGGLMGLQSQVTANVIRIVCGMFRGLGSVAMLWLISPTIMAFFLFQVLAGAIETAMSSAFLWRGLPFAEGTPRFSRKILGEVWHFSAGMTAITVTSLILSQSDKLVISRMMTLEEFGCYMLAWSVASVQLRAGGPIVTAVYPKINQLVARGHQGGLAQLYHLTSQLISVLLFPSCAMLVFFGKELLYLWTGDANITNCAGPLVRILCVGTCLQGVMYLPFLTQLAHGWTSLPLIQNLVSTIVLLPLMIALTHYLGILGAAFVWVIVNSGQLLCAVPIMHNRLLREEKWPWFVKDVGLPLLASVASAGIFWLLISVPTGSVACGVYLALVFGASVTTACLVARSPREWIWKRLLGAFKDFTRWVV